MQQPELRHTILIPGSNSRAARKSGNGRTVIIGAVLAAALAMIAPRANAQLNANIANVSLNATLTESLTVSANPGLVNFTLVPNGVANGSATINVITSWTLRPSNGRVTTYAFFSSSAAALSDGAGDNIPSANVFGSVNGAAFGPFIGAGPFAAGSSVALFTEKITGNTRTKTRVDTLDLQISTVGLTLPAGTYTGVLLIQAQAI